MSGARRERATRENPRGRRIAAALVALALAGAASRAETPVCGPSSTLTPIGIDTTTGLTLLSLAGAGEEGKRWIIELGELDAGTARAQIYPDAITGRYSGSVGRGKILSVAPCGSSCLQVLRWEQGRWQSLGEPIAAPTSSSASATYDRAGAPWLLLQQSGKTPGSSRVLAYRLEHGDWFHRGNMEAIGVGEPGGHAVPEQPDAVTLGSALLSASSPAKPWLEGLPAVSPERRGALVRLGPAAAAYLAADAVLYRTDDGGKRWQRSTWAPGGREGLVGSWRQGLDFSVDFPYGAQGSTLDLAWFDRRGSAEERLFLTRMHPPDRWETLADLSAEVKTKGPAPFPATHVLKPGDDRWLILFGCAATAEGSGLIVRTLTGKELSAARFVPLHVAAP
jgi:hypothetical protein